ncbi:MAG: hypothetical protein V1727_01095 [Candidatus Omnitrophota bacterium]
MLEVMIISPEKVIFEGKAESVILPGDQGTFEIQAYHKNLLSRLLAGAVVVDGVSFPIRRGVAKVKDNKVIVVSEMR